MLAGPAIKSAAGADVPTPSVALSDAPWQRYKERHGVTIERRPVKGSHYFEYRAAVSAQLPPEAIIDHLFSHVTDGNAAILKKRQVLKQSATEIVCYDQIRTKVVSDRDYTILIRKLSDPNQHRYQLTFETANHLGPPADPHYVRIPAIRGAWIAESDDKGGSRLIYQSYSEPGGSIPAFLIHGAQIDQFVSDLERVVDRLRQLAAKG